MVSKDVGIAISIIVILVLAAIGAVAIWWILYEQPKKALSGVTRPPPCPTDNPMNTDPAHPCTPQRNMPTTTITTT